MKRQIPTLLILSVISLIFVIVSHAQQISSKKRDRSALTGGNSQADRAEALIREVYSKAVEFNRSNQYLDQDLKKNREIRKEDLEFKLTDFHSGSIQEILNKRYVDLLSLPTGDVISLSRTTHSTNKGAEEATFEAEWTKGSYASGFDPEWTISNALQFEPVKYADVGSYTSYSVSVSFKGRTRTYKALVVFHNLNQSSELGVPEFWDPIVDGINRVWEEKRPAYKTKPELQDQPVLTNEFLEASNSGSLNIEVSSLSPDGSGVLETQDTLLAGDPPKFWFVLDESETEHASGNHGGTALFTPICQAEPNNRQRCDVEVTQFAAIESGTLDSVFDIWFHKGVKDRKTETNFGPASTEISCTSAVGVAFSTCLIGTNCQVNVSVGITARGAGASATVTGGNLWHDGKAVGNVCRIGTVAGEGTCTTPAFNGTCPVGSTPNGSGFCCFNQPTCGSLTFINKCYMYGGDYDFLTCSCLGCDTCGGSPVVIDVNGDGIALSGPTAGVDFDLNGNGTRDRLGWTLANSDDAWLVLDRNGNGNIDNGAELFGDFTPQPATASKNGFLALAEFDKVANGGNADNVINNEDSIFTSLRLWQDKNHNGIAEAAELKTLNSLNVKAFELDFKESKRVDEFGNEFKYRAKVKDTKEGKVGRWAWDVFLSH